MSAAPSPTACALTVVEAQGGVILAKRWNADGTATPYGNARTVTLHAQPVADFAALADTPLPSPGWVPVPPER